PALARSRGPARQRGAAGGHSRPGRSRPARPQQTPTARLLVSHAHARPARRDRRAGGAGPAPRARRRPVAAGRRSRLRARRSRRRPRAHAGERARGQDRADARRRDRMNAVQTVTGPKSADDLGRVLMHEHVITRSPGLREDYPGTYPRAEVARVCIEGLTELKAAGIDTLVDHSPYDLGRDVELLAELSAADGVTIVAAPGVWIEPQRFWQQRAPVESAELLIADLERGVGGTG